VELCGKPSTASPGFPVYLVHGARRVRNKCCALLKCRSLSTPCAQCGNEPISSTLHCGFVGLPEINTPTNGGRAESNTMAMRGHMRFVVCMCFAALGGTAATTEMRMMMLCLMPVSSAVRQVELPQSTPPMAELKLRRLQTNAFTDSPYGNSLRSAVREFVRDPNAAIATHGPISNWDVSAVTSMSQLFKDLDAFNADISGWKTSGVKDMSNMFEVFTAHALPPLSS